MAASKQASIHTHVYNAVTLVWGSLRLAPIMEQRGLRCKRYHVLLHVVPNAWVCMGSGAFFREGMLAHWVTHSVGVSLRTPG